MAFPKLSPTIPGFLSALRNLITGPEDVGDVELPTPAPIRGAGAQALWDATEPPSTGPEVGWLRSLPDPGGMTGPGVVPGISASDLPPTQTDWAALANKNAMRALHAMATPPAAFQGATGAGAPAPPADWETLIPRPAGVSQAPAAAAAGPGSGAAAAGGRGAGFSWSGAAPSASQLGAERKAFLAGGQSPEISGMADAIRGRQLAAENIAENRPDLYAAGLRENEMENSEAGTPGGRAGERQRLRDEGDVDLATRGLRRAILGRDIDVEQGLGPSLTFMRPEAGAARYQQFSEGMDQYQNPRQQAILEQQFQRELQKAILSAYGRLYGSPMGGALAPDLGALGGFFGVGGGGGVMPNEHGAMGAPGGGAAGPTPPDGGPAVRRTRSGQMVKWDGQGWAIQE